MLAVRVKFILAIKMNAPGRFFFLKINFITKAPQSTCALAASMMRPFFFTSHKRPFTSKKISYICHFLAQHTAHSNASIHLAHCEVHPLSSYFSVSSLNVTSSCGSFVSWHSVTASLMHLSLCSLCVSRTFSSSRLPLLAVHGLSFLLPVQQAR